MNPPDKSQEETTPVEQMTYEQAFSELESIVNDLESNDRTLEQTLAMFERGQVLARYCTNLLENAELKVQELTDGDLLEIDP
jgi:exodeoxyribonuclease VII small subunit